MLESEALRRNLEETAVTGVEFDPRYAVLREAVEGYQGVLKALDHLLFELHHPYVNYSVVIGELRGFALKNLATLNGSARGTEAVRILLETFLETIGKAPKEAHKIQATNGLLAFLEKIVQVTEPDRLARILPALGALFSELENAPPPIVETMAKSFHPVARLLQNLERRLAGQAPPPRFWEAAARLLLHIHQATLEYWLKQEDPVQWLQRTLKQYRLQLSEDQIEHFNSMLEPVSHRRLGEHRQHMEQFAEDGLDLEDLRRLAQLPGFLDIVRQYRNVAQQFGKFSCELPAKVQGEDGEVSQEVGLHLLFLFHLVEMEGLASIHEEILRQVNRSLLCLVPIAPLSHLRNILPRSFALLKQQVGNFPRTALQCIEALGAEVFRRDNTRLTEIFLEQVVRFGFQSPGVQGVDTEWHILCNPAHLQNIRVWLKLISHHPKVCGTLLSALIINLQLGGTCIRDTDLFQKDVSQLLNCEIEPVYNLIKQLAKILPVYFNEIGAEGLLRDVSTELDEIWRRQDVLIHFLRKQSHVESNNLIVDFIEAILCFWYSGEPTVLGPFLPPEMLEQVRSHGPYVDHVQRLLRHLAETLGLEPFRRHTERLLNISEEQLGRILGLVPDVPPSERRRLELLIRMYRLETLKYKLGTQEIRHHLEEARNWGFEGLEKVLNVLENDDPEACIEGILNELEILKEVILSKEHFDAREDIYHKRHIAADIPSMYGRYHERKFDALSLSFRLENLANIQFERLIAGVEVPFITRSNFVRVVRCLRLFSRALLLDGVHSKKFSTYLTLLEQSLDVRRFSFSQYLDIVRGLSEGVKDMIYVHYISPHQHNLARILRQFGPENLLPKYRTRTGPAENESNLYEQVTERFLRDLIATSFGLQSLDNFVARIYQILGEQKEILSERDLDLLLSYSADRVMCRVHEPNPETRNLIHLGNKGYNMVTLAEEGLPVPAGAVVTTEVFRCYPLLQKFPRVYRDYKWQLAACVKDIEKRAGRSFGDASGPLLLSVRSGAAISMPGMMATIINVGSNIETVKGLARKTANPWFAWDNYRRFIQSWAMAFGMNRDTFTDLMQKHKKRHEVLKKREFTGDQMKELALAYRRAVLDYGMELEDDPFEQLLMAIRLVLGSWNSDKAKAYREIMDISDNWGTAVLIQAMAYGNISESSGTGVVFTSNPDGKLDRVSLWGDYTPGNQGEDIVSGLVSTYPISVEQREAMGFGQETSLEESFPDIYGALLECAKHLIYEKKWNPQEIEFTFEGPGRHQLFVLQSRNMTTKKRETLDVFVPTPELETSYLGRGIGVSGGALSGKAVFTLAEIEKLRAEEPETPLILIRPDTVPDDIKQTSLSDGLLTAKGGQTSHAAIVAFRLDKTCVVGCKQLQVFDGRGYARIHGKTLRAGEFLSIDGRSGSVYQGSHPTQDERELL